ARLGNAAADRIGDQLLMPFAPRLAVIDLRDQVAIGIERVGIDAGEGAYAVARRPGAGTLAVGDGDAFAALDERPDFPARNDDRLKSLHRRLSTSPEAPCARRWAGR